METNLAGGGEQGQWAVLDPVNSDSFGLQEANVVMTYCDVVDYILPKFLVGHLLF